MCERNKVEMLMSFNFLGFSKEVERALDFKARTSDPLERPLYSHICYAWFVKRGDYRRGTGNFHLRFFFLMAYYMAAATIMYDRARRLDLEDKPTWDERYNLLEFQLEAYTHAIHALCLLDSRDAWIAVGTNPDAEGDPASGFGYGYQSNNMAKNRDSEIVELEDMRRESELCRARRELLFRMYKIRGKMADEGNYGQLSGLAC